MKMMQARCHVTVRKSTPSAVFLKTSLLSRSSSERLPVFKLGSCPTGLCVASNATFSSLKDIAEICEKSPSCSDKICSKMSF